jgi:hypothetical protein
MAVFSTPGEYQKGADIMSRFSSLVLTAALLCVGVTVGLRGQGPAGGGGQGEGGQKPITLPDSAGKEMVQAACTKCHGLNQITGSTGYTKEKWQDLFSTMVRLPDAHAATVSQYLAAHFPPRPGREPVLVSGPVTVTFKEWMVRPSGRCTRPRAVA